MNAIATRNKRQTSIERRPVYLESVIHTRRDNERLAPRRGPFLFCRKRSSGSGKLTTTTVFSHLLTSGSYSSYDDGHAHALDAIEGTGCTKCLLVLCDVDEAAIGPFVGRRFCFVLCDQVLAATETQLGIKRTVNETTT